MIKRLINSSIPKICATCLGFSAFISYGRLSFLFFGEPDYPVEIDEEC